jgi:hypothetical protein
VLIGPAVGGGASGPPSLSEAGRCRSATSAQSGNGTETPPTATSATSDPVGELLLSPEYVAVIRSVPGLLRVVFRVATPLTKVTGAPVATPSMKNCHGPR